MSKSEQIVVNLLNIAGIKINGGNPWDIQVHNPRLYSRVIRHTALGLGESYMDGWWDCPSLDQFFDRLLRARLDEKVKGSFSERLKLLRTKIFNLQNFRHAFRVGTIHYDKGNDLYQAMLDKRLCYSCGYWKNAKTLDEAQEAKLDLICRKLDLQPGMKVLDIGCGWGSFAKYASEKYEVEVTGITVSKEQLALARKLCAGLPVKLHLADYRTIKGKFDRVLSIGAFEHVGHKNYRHYMQITDSLLKPQGYSLIQTIAGNYSSTSANAWTTKYIFPYGMIPSLAQIGTAAEKLFVIEDLHNFGPDYDKTLMAWYENFEKAWEKLKSSYNERFRRMWRYYLLSSAAGFRSRQTQLWQLVLSRLGQNQPPARLS